MQRTGLLLIAGCMIVAFVLFTSVATTNPYPLEYRGKNYFHSGFFDAPRTLDPARNEGNNIFLSWSIYEPPLQYHFLKRPPTLVPLTATEVPKPAYFDKDGRLLSGDPAPELVQKAVYTIRLTPGIRFQNHPCFAANVNGNALYLGLANSDVDGVRSINDFPVVGTRELTAADYVWQIKRLALPSAQSAVFGCLEQSCEGFSDLVERVRKQVEAQRVRNELFVDLDAFDFPGARVIDRYTYQIVLTRKYPQFIYWFATPHFAPMPHEADAFFSQSVLRNKGLSLDNSPVGTGAFRLEKFDPSAEIVLTRNENFHGEKYPFEGETGDREQGFLNDAGKALPFIEKAVYRREAEQIPRWLKFRQGYYDISLLVAENFDSSVNAFDSGNFEAAADLSADGIKLHDAVHPVLIYFAFNMKDPVVGGYSEKQRNLRQALSIALDSFAFGELFRNGRDFSAQGPIPPGQFGIGTGASSVNPFTSDWQPALNRAGCKSLEEARNLLAKAGFPGGIGADGHQLKIYFDNTYSISERPLLEWMRNQFARINVDLQIRSQDAGRLQENINGGNFQLIRWAWHARNPDPESYLFPFYGPNGKNAFSANMSHYDNDEFNRMYRDMEGMQPGPQREELVRSMVRLLQQDSPWIWVGHLKEPLLSHSWFKNEKPLTITAGWGGAGVLKFRHIDPVLRESKRTEWNSPRSAWLLAPLLMVALIGACIWREHLRKENETAFTSWKEE